MKAVMREVLTSSEFWDSDNYFTRYSWPVEFVARAFKDIGWSGVTVNDALSPLGNMGQNLYDPPDVAGWELGQGWFSTASMLARMNFASTLAGKQIVTLGRAAQPYAKNPSLLISFVTDSLKTARLDSAVTRALTDYVARLREKAGPIKFDPKHVPSDEDKAAPSKSSDKG